MFNWFKKKAVANAGPDLSTLVPRIKVQQFLAVFEQMNAKPNEMPYTERLAGGLLVKTYFCSAVVVMALTAGACQTLAKPEPRRATTDRYAALFAGYPKSDALSHQITEHRPRPAKPAEKTLFFATWFGDGDPKVAMQSTIDSSDRADDCRDVYDWAVQVPHSYRLTGEQLAAVQTALAHLPKSAVRPHLRDLLIVSFHHGDRWETRTYDRTALPDSVRQIFALTRAPLSDTTGDENSNRRRIKPVQP